jgi:N-acetylglucosaminyldiphosphoundecaprenol N-acetyl-beta-D-mannosaminyltransferase
MNTCLKSNSLTKRKNDDLQIKAYSLLGVKIHRINYNQAIERILEWSSKSESRYVCLANVHMVMEAYDSPEFKQILNQADLVTPDGKPLSWLLQSNQVCGRELTLQLCQLAQENLIPVGFYGGKKQVLDELVLKIQERYPSLTVSYAYSPPFHSLSLERQNEVVKKIKETGTKILFVGLGCPKQERWMSLNKHRLSLVMLGIGGAFDVLSGAKPCPPFWIQNLGLEWLFRLCLEPKRLWYRNLYHSSRFLISLALLKSVKLIKTLCFDVLNLLFSGILPIKK